MNADLSPVSDAANSERPGRVLVTGCAGFLGSQLAERLLDDGHEVVGVDCFSDFYGRPLKEANLERLRDSEAFELHEIDLSTDPLDDLVDGVGAVYHLAAQAGVRGSFGDGFDVYVRNNIRATQRLLEAAGRHPVDAFVYASSSSVYGNAESFPTGEDAPRLPVSPYGMTKCATEDLAGVYQRNHGVPVVGLRYFTVYGPRQRPDMAFSRFIAAALAREPLTILGDGLQIRDFTYVDDVVEATVAAGARGIPGSVYNVGGGSPVPLMAAVSLLGELTGKSVDVEYQGRARGDTRQTGSDSSLARVELGFTPAVSLEEGFAQQLRWTIERQGWRRLQAA